MELLTGMNTILVFAALLILAIGDRFYGIEGRNYRMNKNQLNK